MVEREVEALHRQGIKNITVTPFENLLMHFAADIGASVIVRGLRAASDFEYEIQMAAMNYRMNPKIETVFLSANEGDRWLFPRASSRKSRGWAATSNPSSARGSLIC